MLISLIDAEKNCRARILIPSKEHWAPGCRRNFGSCICYRTAVISMMRKVGMVCYLLDFPIKYGRIPINVAYKELVEDFPKMKGRVPFAFDEGGNYFVLALSGEEQDEVGLWIMDTEEYHVVADTFPEFLNRLEL